MLKKKIDFKRVKRTIIGGSEKRLVLEGKNIEVGIENRTLGGKDVNFKSFKKYSKSYAKAKGSTKVTLSAKGNMLGAISSKKITSGIRFYFNANEETQKAEWNNKTRKFFGVDKQQIKYLKKKMGKL